EKFESSGSAKDTVKTLDRVALGVQDFQTSVGDHLIEDMVFFGIIQKFRPRILRAAGALGVSCVVNLNGHHAVGIRVSERLDEDAFDHAEDSGGGADS